MINFDAIPHTRGESVYLDDIIEPDGLLHIGVVGSSIAHGKIRKLDIEKAKGVDGVVAVLTAKDIPGENQIGSIIPDEPLLADDDVKYIGEPIVLVVAKSKKQAYKAFGNIHIEIDELPAITDPREAYKKGEIIAPPRTFLIGSPNEAWSKCDKIIEGRVDSRGQEHLYLEAQCAMSIPVENGGMTVFSSTQSPTSVQKTVAKVLGIPMHKIEVDTRRLGGGFGGKEDQASSWAAMTALAAFILKKPVKLVLNRHEDLVMSGKRHPYSSDFKIGLDKNGKILVYEVMFYQNSGAVADLSTSILERTLLHATNTYYIPNAKITAVPCRTNLVPFTAFRGFGGPQGMFVIEWAIQKASEALKIPAYEIQKRNLLSEGDPFPYGMKVKNCMALRCWKTADKLYDFNGIFKSADEFNKKNVMFKKGVAVMPLCFGISFTSIFLNQAGALVHVYNDGSVSVSTGAIEMGQGVNMKMLQIAAQTFSIDPKRVKVETTNTSRVANTSPTAASTGADMNGKATQIACLDILSRLLESARKILGKDGSSVIEIREEIVFCNGKPSQLKWDELVAKSYFSRTHLSSAGYYATPEIYFDKTKEKGEPFAYHVFGTAIITATLDCLRGTYEFDGVKLVHDVGKSINPLIDKGQIEGALLQGMGWLTLEDLVFDKNGRLMTSTSSSYKVPDIKFTPAEVKVHFLEDADNPYAVLNSKAIGEPPFMYGIGAYFAIVNAMKAFCPDKDYPMESPVTPERVLKFLYSDKDGKTAKSIDGQKEMSGAVL